MSWVDHGLDWVGSGRVGSRFVATVVGWARFDDTVMVGSTTKNIKFIKEITPKYCILRWASVNRYVGELATSLKDVTDMICFERR